MAYNDTTPSYYTPYAAVAPQAVPAGALPASAQPNYLMPSQSLIGPGGGALNPMTNLSGGQVGSEASYGGYNSYLLGMMAPRGQTFAIGALPGDDLEANHTIYTGADNPIQVVDGAGNVLYSGVGYEGAQAAADLTRQLAADKTVDSYSVQGFDPYTGQWQGLAGSTRPKSGLGEFAGMVAPLALSLALPGIGYGIGSALTGALGTAGTAGLGAALGSAAVGTARGQGVGQILQNAALSGGLAYAGGSIPGLLNPTAPTGVLGSGVSSGVGTGVGTGVGAGTDMAAQFAKGIIPVTAKIGSAAGNLLSGTALGSTFANAINSSPSNNMNDTIVVTPNSGPINNIGTNLLGQAVLPSIGAAAPGALSAVTTPNNDKIIVTGEKTAALTPEQLAAVGIPAASAAGLVTATGGQPAKPPSDPTTIEDIRTWLDRANLAASVLGPLAGAVGGGGGGSGATLSPGALASLGTLNPIFSSQLPASNLAARAPRDMSGTDWNNYGMGAEKSFFTDVPQRLAEGGLAQSDGRSDDVPAMLSRGEYVIDAETMALLGNGDPMAGADKMDQWRVNVRKHKGRQLMKGDISPNAKMPKDYMGGGRI